MASKKELLGTLIDKLKCTFATTANSEEILLEVPAEPESFLVNKTVFVFGGSNISSVVPELEKMAFALLITPVRAESLTLLT